MLLHLQFMVSGSKEGKTSINYNNSFRWGTPINMNHMMNSVDFASWMNDTFANLGNAVFFDANRMEQIVAYHNATPYKPGQRITSDGTIMTGISAGDNGYWLDGYGYGIDDVDWYSEISKNTTSVSVEEPTSSITTHLSTIWIRAVS